MSTNAIFEFVNPGSLFVEGASPPHLIIHSAFRRTTSPHLALHTPVVRSTPLRRMCPSASVADIQTGVCDAGLAAQCN
ncbi:hypothetical protein PISMIDRAFT_673884 [Pisolithus microcarpus 441]|uniref:Uncharacterized protein n=1 Tax=Pisolithus microcarpus 441 TaxID=765257 RepID=A0A0C9ZFW6_9AGAM|nr:hypothetical protein PISMIDRAFT_673884 [Pisolithus microcarpus 441]